MSLAGDATKVVIFSNASLFSSQSLAVVAAAVPLMLGGVLLGQRINRQIGERGYAALFWAVMFGYAVRLALPLAL